MRRILCLIVAFCGIGTMMAQSVDFDKIKRQKPDFKEINRQINDRTSIYYYPRLMKEYLANDTIMKLDKYRYLYLGYCLQEDYNPYRTPSQAANVAMNINRANLTKHECETVIKQAKQVLDDNPFDLQQMALLISALRQNSQTALADIWQYKFNYILMAIVSTGTGMDEDNGWYVIEPQHEYVLLNTMGYIITNHLFYEPYYEYLTVSNPSGSPAGGYYFNIHHILEEYYRKFPDELE